MMVTKRINQNDMTSKGQIMGDFVGLSKEYGFYSKWDGKPLEGFDQGSNRILFTFYYYSHLIVFGCLQRLNNFLKVTKQLK